MENASKALLIAGAMLLMVLVLTFAVYVVRRIGGQTSELYGEIEQSKIDEFNQKFLNFNSKKDSKGIIINPLTIQDVVSIINLAKDNNKNGKFPVIVKVTLNNDKIVGNEEKKDIDNDGIKKLLENTSLKYSCKVEYGKKINLVEFITIEEIKS